MPDEPIYPVSVERARQHVVITLSRFRDGNSPPAAAALGKMDDAEPFLVYDINGRPLFYLFKVRGEDGAPGVWVRAAADKAVGPAILSMNAPRTEWDPWLSLTRAHERAREEFPDGVVGKGRLVCYSYPRIGVQIPVGSSQTVIYDAVSLSRVPVREAGSRAFGAWSYFEIVIRPEFERRLAIWESDDAAIASTFNGVVADAPYAMLLGAPTADTQSTVQLLQYSTNCKSHDCFALYRQQTDFYCTVASAQMILDFYRYSYSQDMIAAEIGAALGSPLPDDTAEQNAYEALSNNGLVATIAMHPDWTDAQDEINANRPFRDGIEGHARVCTGWAEEVDPATGNVKRKLRLHDPWPWNTDICTGGDLVWEDWNAIPHLSFIYVRH